MSVRECVASDDSGNGAYGKGLDGICMEIAFRARRCSIPVAPFHSPETGERLLVAALRKFGKFSWRFDVCSNRQFCLSDVVPPNRHNFTQIFCVTLDSRYCKFLMYM